MLELLKSKILVSDGAIGTELLKLSNEKNPEILNFKKPSLVEKIHTNYINAGADIITTNSFGANSARLKGVNIYELAKASAQIARKVKTDDKFIFGSVGPTGLKPTDEEFKKIADYFSEQIYGLNDGGVDAILIETMIFIEEMKVAYRVARTETRLPVVVTMSFHLTKNGFQTYGGADLKTSVKEMLNLGAEIIGANCGNGFNEMTTLAEKLKSMTKETFIMIKPSAGTPKRINDKLIYPDTPDSISKFVEKLVDLGINIIGGCCGTTPEHIKVIREIVNKAIQSKKAWAQ